MPAEAGRLSPSSLGKHYSPNSHLRGEVKLRDDCDTEAQRANLVSDRVRVVGRANEEQIWEWIIQADSMAEIHHTPGVLTPTILKKDKASST